MPRAAAPNITIEDPDSRVMLRENVHSIAVRMLDDLPRVLDRFEDVRVLDVGLWRNADVTEAAAKLLDAHSALRDAVLAHWEEATDAS